MGERDTSTPQGLRTRSHVLIDMHPAHLVPFLIRSENVIWPRALGDGHYGRLFARSETITGRSWQPGVGERGTSTPQGLRTRSHVLIDMHLVHLVPFLIRSENVIWPRALGDGDYGRMSTTGRI